MPGPGPHMLYTLGIGTAIGSLSKGRFTPHHCLVYAVNAFLGPDIGSFSEWLTSTLGIAEGLGSQIMDIIHHPFYYILILGIPLSIFYSWVSKVALQKGLLSASSGENGHSRTFTWIISTGWWEGRAPVNNEAVIVVGFLCICLLLGFTYINRVKPGKVMTQSNQSSKLIGIIAILYCLWCASQIYWRNPRQPAVGEEADLGVIIFMTIYFFLPHGLCIAAMDSTTSSELPL
ncbi:uncharacterized protein LOC131062727 isoform X2 [Cryptomeria japonica]|uniref:uncharacterized protein LOC131062727 isoform X2 n=1 Tax=Cryptomeria japonica TaxID=3369 RepID=UPI0027D9FDC0|nr:uncharacterized protein LOC131062727 isoform X2 [Cryptomeria japonica]